MRRGNQEKSHVMSYLQMGKNFHLTPGRHLHTRLKLKVLVGCPKRFFRFPFASSDKGTRRNMPEEMKMHAITSALPGTEKQSRTISPTFSLRLVQPPQPLLAWGLPPGQAIPLRRSRWLGIGPLCDPNRQVAGTGLDPRISPIPRRKKQGENAPGDGATMLRADADRRPIFTVREPEPRKNMEVPRSED